MDTDTTLCAFVPPGWIGPCGYPRDHGLHSFPSAWSGAHPFTPSTPDVCHYRGPRGMSCGKPRDWHLDGGEHGFVSAEEYARQQSEKLTREYLVPSTPCTFRLAGGPCGLEPGAISHRPHTDHPGFCGVYTCHEYRAPAPEPKPWVAGQPMVLDEGATIQHILQEPIDRLTAAVDRLTAALEARKDDGR